MPINHHHIRVTKDRETKRQVLLEKLADNVRKPETAPWNREALRDMKRDAWPTR